MDNELVVAPRYSGPPGSANGGYFSGLLSGYVDGPAEVTLRLPPPLATPMRMHSEDGDVRLFAGEDLIAEATPTLVELDPPVSVPVDVAARAASAYAGLQRHPFPGCFVCGPDRDDGLRIFAGPVPERDLVAAPWTPATEFAGPDGAVLPEFVSAALDCAGAWSLELSPGRPMVLGRFAVRQDAVVPAGVPLVVIGWPIGVDGRKLFAGTALYDEHGTPLAVARATWIELRR